MKTGLAFLWRVHRSERCRFTHVSLELKIIPEISMDMRIVFEEDLALAILHADLAYIDCSLEHELPQSASHGNHHETSPSPAQFPTAKVVRSTLEEPTFDPDQPSSNSLSSRGKKTNSVPNPSAPKDEIEPSAAPLVSMCATGACFHH